MPPNAASDEPQRSEKWKARRDVIIDTSAPVFARQGYHATGIAELCAVNGLGKGAFYHYIESKEELLAAIHDRVMDEVMLGADRVAQAGGSPSAQLAMLGDELLDVIHRYPDHVWVFLHEFPALTDERAEQFRGRRRRVRAPGRGGPAGRHRLRRVPRRRPEAHGARVARHAQLHVPVAQAGRPHVGARRREAVRRHLHPRDRDGPRRRTSASSPRARSPGARRACRRPARPARRPGDRRAASRSARGSRGTFLPRAGSRCPTRSSTSR